MSPKHVLNLTLVAALLGTNPLAADQEMRLFRIGTGGVGGTYYPVGSLIAQAISQPPNSLPCEDPEVCGVPGLVAVAQTANGSVANVKAVGTGVLESGFAQSDVAYWAYSGTGVFADQDPISNLRAIAALYPETVHIVARRGADIQTVGDLRGKRVSLDEPGSGTLVDARLVLAAYGLSEDELDPEYIKPALAAERVNAGELDAFFIVAGHPVSSIQSLARDADITIIPIEGGQRRQLLEKYRFFSAESIESGTYTGVGDTPTISVPAIWVTRSDVEDELVYKITMSLWNKASRRLMDAGHPKAGAIRLENALNGLAVPIHPGAKRFYREKGLIPR
jgi:TRAP transporter TAXI family solute receptor